MKMMILLGINPSRLHFWIIFGINFDHEDDDSAWYQPHQGGLASFLDHLGNQVFDHEGESARYQYQQGGLEALFGSF